MVRGRVKLKIFFGVFMIISLLSATQCFSELSKYNFGIFGGWPLGGSSSAIESNSTEYIDTEFSKRSEILGIKLSYILMQGLGVDLSIMKHDMNLEISGEYYGKLNLMPIILSLTIKGRPALNKSRWSPSFGLGVGFSINDFNNSPWVAESTENNNLDVKNSFVMAFDFGMHYFFTRRTSADAHILWYINEASVKGLGGDEKIYMQATNFPIMLGLSYWF